MSKLLYAHAAGARHTGNEQTARAADVHMRHMQEASQHRKKSINTHSGAAPLMVRLLEELNPAQGTWNCRSIIGRLQRDHNRTLSVQTLNFRF